MSSWTHHYVGYMPPVSWLRVPILQYFSNALRNQSKNTRGAIDDAGRAFEDFLRRVATDKGVSVTHCTGIQQVADALRGSNLIEVKHLDLCKGINSIRIAASHSKDRLTGKHWTFKGDTALDVILITLMCIRSIYNYVFKQINIF